MKVYYDGDTSLTPLRIKKSRYWDLAARGMRML